MKGKKPQRKGLLAGVVQAALDFHALRLWERYENDDCIVFLVPDEPEPMVASIMGQAGMEFGLCIYRGKSAFRHTRAVLESEGIAPDVDLLEETSQMSFSIEPMAEIPPSWARALKRAGVRGNRDKPVPLFLVKEPGRQPRELKPQDAEKLLYVLNGILKAFERGDLNPRPFDPREKLLTITLSGDPFDPEVVVELRQHEASLGEEVPTIAAAPGELDDLPLLPGRWLVGCPVLPASIEGEERTVRGLVVLDAATELILQVKPFLGSDMHEAASILFEVFAGDNAAKKTGLPGELDFSSRALFDAAAPELSRLGVRCRYVESIPQLDEVMDHLGAAMGLPADEADDSSTESALPPEHPPAPDDLEGWKEADRQLTQYLVAHVMKKDLLTSRALARYFGSEEEARQLLEGEKGMPIWPPLLEWLIVDYRPTRKSRTVAENLTGGRIPQAARMLLEARMKARPSLYRIEKVDPPNRVTFLDITSGERVVIHDWLLAESRPVDHLIAARCFAAGDFHFIALLGPGIPPGLSARAMDYLEDEGLELEPEEARIDTHLFGRLWSWLEEIKEAGPPRLTNTDGEDLLWHTASFTMDSPDLVSGALGRRPDIEFDDEEGEYVWMKRSDPDDWPEKPETVLGRIELIGGELVLQVNSRERLERARGWLEEIPGVRLHGVRTRSIPKEDDDVPLDDRLGSKEPVSPSPEVLQQLGEMIRQQYLQWLDESLPALGGQTPREACRTEEGRRKVTRLIRAIPRPSSSDAVDAPREEMLRELGLEGKGD